MLATLNSQMQKNRFYVLVLSVYAARRFVANMRLAEVFVARFGAVGGNLRTCFRMT